ncbi:MAG: c-type cytochrome, partial [SAR324 cluster bacterium]|nr:c-type cytochrome [SAR324 cluster bacterium]
MLKKLTLLLVGIGMCFAQFTWAAGNPEKGKALYAVCVACHGTDGAGNKALNSPRIAGQEIWYLERQLK